ncbi:unnamed protein product [Symbiodinium sp. KB8]|nr:unnamed protein product [Symbiodinium sp. KB8]
MPPKKNKMSPQNREEYNKILQNLQASGALQQASSTPPPDEPAKKRKSGKQPASSNNDAEDQQKTKRAKPAPSDEKPEPKAKAKNKGGRPPKQAADSKQKEEDTASKEKKPKTTGGGKKTKKKAEAEEEEEQVEEFYDSELGIMVSWKNFPEVVKKVLEVHPAETPGTVAQGFTETLGPCPEELKGNIPEESSGSARHPGPILEDESLQEKEDDEEDLDGEEYEEDEEEEEPPAPPPKPAKPTTGKTKAPEDPKAAVAKRKTPPTKTPASAKALEEEEEKEDEHPAPPKPAKPTSRKTKAQEDLEAPEAKRKTTATPSKAAASTASPTEPLKVTPKSLDKDFKAQETNDEPKEAFKLKRMDSLMPRIKMTSEMADQGRPASPEHGKQEDIADLLEGMDDSASQVVVESANTEQMTTMLKELVTQNLEMKKALAAKATTAGPPEGPKAGAKADPELDAVRKDLQAQLEAPDEDDDAADDDEEIQDGEDGEGEEEEGEENHEEEEESTAENASTVTPAPKTAKPAPALTPPPSEAPREDFSGAKSSTHRKEWMMFGRKMENPDAGTKFPQLVAIWESSKEDKLKVFRQWLTNGMDFDKTKIEAAVRKPGNAVPDEDCPDDPASPELANAILGNPALAALSAATSKGKEVKRELTAGSVALDLPKKHELRIKMTTHETELKEQLEVLKEFDDLDSEEDQRQALMTVEIAENIGRGYTSIRNAGGIGDIYDSDLLRNIREPDMHNRAKMKTIVDTGHLHTLVLKLHAFVTAFRGDWKALRQVFNFERYADRDQVGYAGYDTYVVLEWLGTLCEAHRGVLPNDLCTAMWCATHVMSLLHNAGRHLTVEQQRNKEFFGQLFMKSYVQMAHAMLQCREKLFRMRPKFHILGHIFRSSPPSRTNPANYSTWMDEDSLKKLMRVLKMTDSHTAKQRLLQRWLLALPEVWAKECGKNSVRGIRRRPGSKIVVVVVVEVRVA